MKSLHRPHITTLVAVTALSVTALSLTACNDDDSGEPPAFTSTSSPTDSTVPTETSRPSGTPTTPGSPDVSAPSTETDTTAPPSRIDSVTVTASAPEEQTSGFQFIQVGENRFEMLNDIQKNTYSTLPAVSWKTGTRSGKCSTLITVRDQAGEVIAQQSSRECEYTAEKDTADNDFEWIDRSLLPERGSEAPITIRVSVTPDGGTETVGEQTIVIRNPNNYR